MIIIMSSKSFSRQHNIHFIGSETRSSYSRTTGSLHIDCAIYCNEVSAKKGLERGESVQRNDTERKKV